MGEMIGLNGFVNITYIKFGGKYYLIEVDPRINSWMAHSRFVTSDNFINGVKKIINGDYKIPMQFLDIKYKDIEVAYFLRDIHRIIKTIKVLAKILLVKIKHAFLFIKHS
jgi:hypothetical protein